MALGLKAGLFLNLLLMFSCFSALVPRPQPYFPQHAGGVAGGGGYFRVHQRLLQRWTTQPVSVRSLLQEHVPEARPHLQSICCDPICASFFLQMSGEDHRRPDHVVPGGHHPDSGGHPQRPRAQLQTAQHLQDRSLPAKPEAALQVS